MKKCLALLVAVCLAILSISTAHAADPEQSISGTVTDSSGAPIAGATVTLYVYLPGETSWDEAWNATTEPDGTYLFSSSGDGELAPGNYRLGFKSNRHLQEFYGDHAVLNDSPLITIEAGHALTGLDAELDPSATISGTVTDESSTPLAGIEVDLYRWEDNGFGGGYWDFFNRDLTGADGSYTVGGVKEGSFQVCFRDPAGSLGGNYVGECYPDQVLNTTLQGGPDGAITLTALEQRAGVDAELELGGSISGTIANEAGDPLPSYSIRIWHWDDQSQDWEEVWFDSTSGDGEWAAYGVPAGTYRVKYEMPYWQEEWAQYADVFYPAAASLESAGDVVVVAGQDTPDVNGVLGLDATISGTVTNQTGSPLPDAEVTAYVWAHAGGGQWLALPDGAFTDENGAYTLANLPAGTYRVGFRGPDGDGEEFYDDKPAVDQAADITPITGQSVTGIDAGLTLTGSGEQPAIENITIPQVTGVVMVGQTLTATPGTWDPSDSATTIQWQANGIDIPGATGSTLNLTSAYANKSIRVRVNAAKTDHTSSVAFSSSVGPVAPAAPSAACVNAQTAVAVAAADLGFAKAKLQKAKKKLKKAKKTHNDAKTAKAKVRKKKAKFAVSSASQAQSTALAQQAASCA